ASPLSPDSLRWRDTATTRIYALSLHAALPILAPALARYSGGARNYAAKVQGRMQAFESAAIAATRTLDWPAPSQALASRPGTRRSEEHTSELQSRENLVCRLLLEKKTKRTITI